MSESECQGFAWIGQRIDSCNDCGKPAWEHDGIMRINKDAGPFAPRNAEHLQPWAPAYIAQWLLNQRVSPERAAHLLAVKP